MAETDNITGVILAGGRSRRFGSNKALALLHGKPLIACVSGSVAAVFNDCLLVTNDPGQYSFLKLPMIGDQYRDMGPLAGIHAALEHSALPWIFVVGCDMPAVTPELIAFLCGLAQSGYEAVIPWPATGPEPLCGLYHKAALAPIEQCLANGRARVKEMLERIAVRKIREEEMLGITGGLAVFSNVNRPEDLEGIP